VKAVTGPWDRLHRAESDILAALLTAAERDAVNRRLGRGANARLGWIPPTGSGRFAWGFGALYLANDLPTCIDEMIYHHALHCRASEGTPPGTRAVFKHLVFQVDGNFADASGRRALHDPLDYGPSWAFGAQARADKLAGVHYRSVRHKGGRCLAAFDETAISYLRMEFGAVVLEWDGGQTVRIA